MLLLFVRPLDCVAAGPSQSEEYTYSARFLGSTLLDEGKSQAVFSSVLKKAVADQEDVCIDQVASRVSLRITLDGIRWVTMLVCICSE